MIADLSRFPQFQIGVVENSLTVFPGFDESVCDTWSIVLDMEFHAIPLAILKASVALIWIEDFRSKGAIW